LDWGWPLSERWFFPIRGFFALDGNCGSWFIAKAAGCGRVRAKKAGDSEGRKVRTFWTLVPFTMQIVMSIIGGYVVASKPIVYRAIQALAEIPKTAAGRGGAGGAFCLCSDVLISWGLSLIFRVCWGGWFGSWRIACRDDYRARWRGGVSWAGGGCGSNGAVAFFFGGDLMGDEKRDGRRRGSHQGLIPLTQRFFLWQSSATTVILIVLSVTARMCRPPSPEKCAEPLNRTAIQVPADSREPGVEDQPGGGWSTARC